MVKCYVCSQLFDEKKTYMDHLRLHQKISNIIPARCLECPLEPKFDNLTALGRHLLDYHFKNTALKHTENAQQTLESLSQAAFSGQYFLEDQHMEQNYDSPIEVEPLGEVINAMLSEDFIEKANTSIFISILGLKSEAKMSEAQLDRILKMFSKIYKFVVKNVNNVIMKLIQNSFDMDSNSKNKVDIKLNRLFTLFDDYDSKYKQLKIIKSFDNFVNSETVYLGERVDSRLADNISQVINKKESFEYVSVRKTLESLLSSDLIVTEINNYTHECEFEPFYYLNHPFWEKKNALRLVLFHDEYEPKNALGDANNLYKVDQFYLSVLNLSRKQCASLRNIFLVATVYSEDEKKYGINSILKNIVQDIKSLETQGITVNGVTYFASIAQTAGDNLGKHQLFNLKQCFRGNNICDKCDATTSSIQEKFKENCFQMKTRDLYTQQLAEVKADANKFKDYGIRGPCHLNELEYFHITSNCAHDIMHDFYEGIVKVELDLVLSALIYTDKCFNLKLINDRLLVFDYGKLDMSNKPGSILEISANKVKVKEKAAKMTCLVRVLPFIIGDKIPRNNLNWKLFTSLSKILDYVNSTNLNLTNIRDLELIIERHLMLFKKLFPDETLKKKHHNLVHYPSALRLLGNLVDYNGLRFEAKHSFAKSAANTAQNTINLPKTITNKIQINSFFHLYTESNLNQEYEIIKKNKTYLNILQPDVSQLIHSHFNYPLDETETVFYDVEVKIFGQIYFRDIFLVLKKHQNLVSICRIKDIILIKDEIIFIVQLAKVSNYDEHYCAYVTELTDEIRLIRKEDIYVYKPFTEMYNLENSANKNKKQFYTKPYWFVNISIPEIEIN